MAIWMLDSRKRYEAIEMTTINVRLVDQLLSEGHEVYMFPKVPGYPSWNNLIRVADREPWVHVVDSEEELDRQLHYWDTCRLNSGDGWHGREPCAVVALELEEEHSQ